MSKVQVIHVSVLMVATSEGQYKNRIIRVGEEFLYEGGLNRKGGLPLWADPVDPVEAKKIVEAAKAKAAGGKAAPSAPVAPPAPVEPVAAVKPLTKAELVEKLVAGGKGEEGELKKLKVEELRALDAQSSIQSAM